MMHGKSNTKYDYELDGNRYFENPRLTLKENIKILVKA
jgi:hypothetical protein